MEGAREGGAEVGGGGLTVSSEDAKAVAVAVGVVGLSLGPESPRGMLTARLGGLVDGGLGPHSLSDAEGDAPVEGVLEPVVAPDLCWDCEACGALDVSILAGRETLAGGDVLGVGALRLGEPVENMRLTPLAREFFGFGVVAGLILSLDFDLSCGGLSASCPSPSPV